MRKIVIGFVSVILVLLSVSVFAATPGTASPPPNTLPQFTSGGHVMGFTPNKVYIAGMGHALTEEFINPYMVTPRLLSSDKVIYENLWKGINLTYEARKTGIAESIYTVHPGADVAQIRITYNAEVTIQKNGALTFNHPTPQGSYTMSAPKAWQEKEGTRIPVQVAYTRLTDTAIGFTTGPYDKNLPLIIDPVYKWHTFYGSSDYFDSGSGIAVDTSGNIYVTGYCDASWGTPINPHSGGDDIMVMKLNSSGAYQWHTFYGSAGDDYGVSVTVDTGGNVYVAGSCQGSWDAPTNSYSGGSDIVVLKLNSSGAYQWHTFYGSAGDDWGNSIAVDINDNIYVTGYSSATWRSPLNPHGGLDDMFVLKLNSSGAYQWHTFYGSSSNYDSGSGIVVDNGGYVYVAGGSNASWGSPINPHSGDYDMFVLKLNSSGAYQWHTFYGSSMYDWGRDIALDDTGNIYVTGPSDASWGSPLNPHGGYYDIMVLKLNSSGAYQWHTFYGSSAFDYGSSIAVDINENIYVTGYSSATWGAPLNPHSGYADIMVLKLNSSGVYQWNTFQGSAIDDYGNSIAVDINGNIYVAGYSSATWGAPLNPHSGVNDIIVLKLAEILSPLEGTIGTRLTVNGTDFGDKKGKVLINDIATKITKDGWTPDRITSTINKPPLPIDVAHPVSVVVNKVSTPIDGTFTLRLPALDDLLITRGAYPDPIHVTGKFFGTKKGKVYLYDPITEKKKNCKVTSWTMNESTGISEITFIVPKTSKSLPAGTYQLQISNKVGPATTSPEFELLDPAP